MQNKQLIFVLAVIIVTAIAGVTVLSKSGSAPQTSATPTASTIDQSVEEENAPIVPLPIEEEIIRTFFNLINEGKSVDAVSMMTQALIGDDALRQTWGVQFNSFKSVKVVEIEPSMQEEWTTTKHTYKVTLDVRMKPEAQSAPILNYGWDNGLNIRWIPLQKVDNIWKIAGIYTGP